MAAYDWETLKQQWEHVELSTEQVIGQLIVWGEQTHVQCTANQRQFAALERQVALLMARVTALESKRSVAKG